jgi:virginiamycin B lyase
MLLSLALAASVATAAPAPQPVLESWKVPWERTRPRDPDVAPDGRIWFVGQTGHYIASFDPATQRFRKIDLLDASGPHNLVIDSKGALYFTGNLKGYIGRQSSNPPSESQFRMPDASVKDPHTLAFAPDGNLWFTAQGGNAVGHLDVKTGVVRLVKMQTERARPYGIAVDASGRPWFNLLGTNKLGTVDPKSMALEEIPLPRAETRTRRIAIDGAGAVWLVDYAAGFLMRFDSKTRAVKEWASPRGKDSRPYAMAMDDKGRMWFAESGPQPNRFVGFDPKSEKFFADFEVTNANGAIRHMVFDRKTRAFWFGTDTDYLMRVTLKD